MTDIRHDLLLFSKPRFYLVLEKNGVVTCRDLITPTRQYIPHKRCTAPIWEYMLRVPIVCCQNQKIPEQTSKQFTSISKPSKQFWVGQNISSVCFGSVNCESAIKRSKAHGQGTCPSQPDSAGGAIGTFASRNQIYSDFDTEFVSCLTSTLRIEQNTLTHLRLNIIKSS